MTQIKRKGDDKMANFKTVKRKAEVGERILITNRESGSIRNGDIGVVTIIFYEDSLYADIRGMERLVNRNEYEVIIEEAGGMNELKDKLAEVAEIAQKLSITFNDIASMLTTAESIKETVEKSPQQIRDEIIEKAKRDVAELVRNGFVHTNVYGKLVVKYIVNKEKRTIVVLLHGYLSGNVYKKGIAKCAPDDCFNVHIGKAIALRRALGFEVPTEYLNAPMPTEVRVGDICKTYDVGGRAFNINVNVEAVRDKFNEDIARDRYGTTIIDDSREEEN